MRPCVQHSLILVKHTSQPASVVDRFSISIGHSMCVCLFLSVWIFISPNIDHILCKNENEQEEEEEKRKEYSKLSLNNKWSVKMDQIIGLSLDALCLLTFLLSLYAYCIVFNSITPQTNQTLLAVYTWCERRVLKVTSLYVATWVLSQLLKFICRKHVTRIERNNELSLYIDQNILGVSWF